jgi:hypothetical protein
MNPVDHTMRTLGFEISDTGGNCRAYSQCMIWQHEYCEILVTDDGGLDLPEAFNCPVIVGIYLFEVGTQVYCERFETLEGYLETAFQHEINMAERELR